MKINKTYKVRKHHVSGKEFLANSYASIKTVNSKNLSFAEKMEIGLTAVNSFDTKNEEHIKVYKYAIAVRKLIASFKSVERQAFKKDLLALIVAETGSLLNMETVTPDKLVRTFLDLNIPITEIQKYGK